MRALLVGAGGMGQTWADNLAKHSDVVLAGWTDVRPGAAEAAAAARSQAWEHTGTDVAEMIDQVGPDFVVDVTPPEVHRSVTLTALGQGIPVIGEKPMADSMDAARAMVQASDDSGKLYMVSQSRRYNARQRELRELIAGPVGGAGIANVDFSVGAHFGGFRDDMASVLLLDMAIHTFDQIRYLTGLDAESVYAEEFNPGWSWFRGDAAANCLFRMQGGARAVYRGSWCSEGAPTCWDGDWRVTGPNGTAVWAGCAKPYAELANGEGFIRPVERVEHPDITVKNGIEGSLEEFLIALNGGPDPMGECHDNIKSLAMVFGAIESARRGERVHIAELLAG